MAARSNNRFPWWGWLIVAAGFILPPILITRWMEPEPADRTLIAAILDDAKAPVIGPADADIVIVIFTDYRCPVCRRTEAAIAALMASDPKVRLMVKDWAILGDASVRGAEAALAARYQGRYAALHEAMMQSSGPLDDAALAAIARDAGLDTVRLFADRKAHADAIAAQRDRIAREAFALKLAGTPGVIVGPFLVPGGLDVGRLRKLVAEARAGAR